MRNLDVVLEDSDDTISRYADCYPFVVEDDENFRLLLTRAFVKAGVLKDRIRMASDGEQAIEAFTLVAPGPLINAAGFPSIIVLDINLPRKSGLDVLAFIRGRTQLAEVPVFMFTSSEHPDHVTRAIALGCDSYYVKPADVNQFQTVVEGMLGFWFTRTCRRLP